MVATMAVRSTDGPTHPMVDEGVYAFQYDALGRNARLTYPDGHVRVQQWDTRGRMVSRCYEYPEGSGVAPRCYTADYDDAGVPIAMTDPEGDDVVASDAVDRLDSVQRTHRRDGAVTVEAYAYNKMGALETNTDTALNLRRPKRLGSGTADATVPLTVDGELVRLYIRGEVVDIGATHLTPNNRGDFTRIASPAATYDFTYGPTGELWSSTKPGAGATRYVYDDDNILAQTTANGEQVTETFLYAGVDHPLRMKRDGTLVYYELDLAGNVRRLRAAGGADMGGYRYSGFGKTYAADVACNSTEPCTPAAAIDQPLRWKGRPFTGAAGGLYNMRARWWSPRLGVFLSMDALRYHDARSTLWGWPGQNPVRWSDPSGRCPTCLIAEGGAVVGAVAYAFTAPTNLSWSEFGANALAHGAAGAAFAVAAARSPAATFLATGAFGVSSEKDLWKLGVAALGGVGGRGSGSCAAKGGAAAKAEALSGGSLTAQETAQLQALADAHGTQIDVVGSRAAGAGRNIESALPVGKGPGTRSDIDIRYDGQVDINTGGRFTNQLRQVGGSAGAPSFSTGPGGSTAPVIEFRPGQPPIWRR